MGHEGLGAEELHARANFLTDELVLERDGSSVEAALSHRWGSGPALGERRGRSAVMKFLRMSLRVRQVPTSWSRHRQHLFEGDEPTQAAAGAMIDAITGKLGEDEASLRRTVDELERARPGQDGKKKVLENESGIKVAYLGAAAPSRLWDARVRHMQAADAAWVDRCWKAIVTCESDVQVSDFAAALFADLRDTTRASVMAESTPTPAAPRIAPQTSPSDAPSAGLVSSPKFSVVALDSIRSREAIWRRFVPSSLLPTRAKRLAELQRFADSRVSGKLTAPHRLVVVCGPHGVGKSEFINEWLLAERDRRPRLFDELLFISSCGSMTEDQVVSEVRQYLDHVDGVPVIVLDGLRTRGGKFVWDVDPIRDTNDAPQAGDLAGLIQSQVGKREFLAVLGVQSLGKHDIGIPRALRQHPRNPAINIVDILRLDLLDIAEASEFARTLLEDEHAAQRDQLVSSIVNWSGGLPLRLAAAAWVPEILAGQSASDKAAQRDRIRSLVNYLDERDGNCCAAMRLISMFRRPLQTDQVEDIVRQVMDVGQPIDRVTPESTVDVIRKAPFFSISPGDTVELHDAIRHVVEEDLAQIVRERVDIALEVRAIHLIAARDAYRRMQRAGEGAMLPERPHSAEGLVPQHDLELACDCVHHLLCTRSIPGPPLPLGERDERLQGLAKKVLCGEASAEEVDRFCYDVVLHRAQINGNAFSSRGLFPLKLNALNAFLTNWPADPPNDPVVARLRRTVKIELAACSIVTGNLRPVEQVLPAILRELYSAMEERTEVLFDTEAAPRRDRDQTTADYCTELAKVCSTYCSALLRRGRIADVAAQSQRLLDQVLRPALLWCERGRHRWPEKFAHETTPKVHRAYRRMLTRKAEAAYLSTIVESITGVASARLKAALDLFEEAESHQDVVGELRAPPFADSLPATERLALARKLGGDSARTYIRCLIRQAQVCGVDSPMGRELVARASEIVDAQIAADSALIRASGWSNDAIGFGILRSMLNRLFGNPSRAEEAMEVVEADPRFKHLGACSLAVRFEMRLERAKLQLPKPARPDALVAELKDLRRQAADAHHSLHEVDALLLLVVCASGSDRAAYLEQARRVYSHCQGCHSRDDVFAWAEGGDSRPWTALSLAI